MMMTRRNIKIMNWENLDRHELIDFIKAYDQYIELHRDLFLEGWQPVCIAEFYDNEYQLEEDI